MDWSQEFPGLARSTYLNSCAHGLLPLRTKRAIEAHLERWTDAPDWDQWATEVEGARRAFARLVHAEPDEIAVQANASTALAAVTGSFQPGPRREILTVDVDFPAAPTMAERQVVRGLRHTHLRTNGLLSLDAWRKRLSDDTALACIPAVASFSGQRVDVAAFARAAHERGVPLLVDAFQAAGTYDIDVKRLDVDFLVTGTYKWLLGPVGIAFLYVKREHHARLPTTSGWHALAEPGAFDPLGVLAPDARRFQYGGPNVLGAAAVTASLGLLQDVGVDAIERHNARLVERVQREAEARKFEVLTPPERASIVTFRVPDLAKSLAALQRENVVVNTRLGGIRASPHFYNAEADVARLFAVLDGMR